MKKALALKDLLGPSRFPHDALRCAWAGIWIWRSKGANQALSETGAFREMDVLLASQLFDCNLLIVHFSKMSLATACQLIRLQKSF